MAWVVILNVFVSPFESKFWETPLPISHLLLSELGLVAVYILFRCTELLGPLLLLWLWCIREIARTWPHTSNNCPRAVSRLGWVTGVHNCAQQLHHNVGKLSLFCILSISPCWSALLGHLACATCDILVQTIIYQERSIMESVFELLTHKDSVFPFGE